jgi:hypothetical protein
MLADHTAQPSATCNIFFFFRMKYIRAGNAHTTLSLVVHPTLGTKENVKPGANE